VHTPLIVATNALWYAIEHVRLLVVGISVAVFIIVCQPSSLVAMDTDRQTFKRCVSKGWYHAMPKHSGSGSQMALPVAKHVSSESQPYLPSTSSLSSHNLPVSTFHNLPVSATMYEIPACSRRRGLSAKATTPANESSGASCAPCSSAASLKPFGTVSLPGVEAIKAGASSAAVHVAFRPVPDQVPQEPQTRTAVEGKGKNPVEHDSAVLSLTA
jgi:hypothetical protein